MRMRLNWLLLAAAVMTVGCGGGTDAPSGPGMSSGNGNGGSGGAGGGGGGGNGGGSAVGAVTVGNIFFQSGHNGTTNPAVDTVAVGGTVTWTWSDAQYGSDGTSHSVRSTGSPSFTSSGILAGSGMTYAFTFNTPGTYRYNCAVHGSAMSGTVVVQ